MLIYNFIGKSFQVHIICNCDIWQLYCVKDEFGFDGRPSLVTADAPMASFIWMRNQSHKPFK